MDKTNENTQAYACQHDTDHHCLTCSDEMIKVSVIGIDRDAGLALVEVRNQVEKIDITLVDDISLGDLLLAHGGVAIGRLMKGGG